MSIRRGYVDIDSGQLHYRVAGDAALPVLVLLHQSPSSSAMYESMMANLQQYFRVLAPDMPGFGNSDPLPDEVTVPAWTAAIEQFLAALKVTGCYVFGHHTGASVAAQLAANQRIDCRALAMSGPTLLSEAQKAALPAQATAFPLQQDGSHLLGMWQRLGRKEPGAALEVQLRETLLGLALGDSYPQAYTAVIEHDFAACLPRISQPVLLMAGARDPLQSCVAPCLEMLDNARAIDLGDTGSWCCDLQAAQIAAELQAFFLPVASAQEASA